MPGPARRDLLKSAAGLSVAGVLREAAESAAAAEVEEPPSLRAQRREAVGRRRRLIYNDDGCGPLMQAGCRTREAFLAGPHSRMPAVTGTQVDSVFFCSGATHVLNHPTAVAESYADVAERYGIGGEWAVFRDNLRALERTGTDAVRLMSQHCRRHALEFVYSHRINDIHNTFLPVERSTWFREHPEYWLNTPEAAARAGGGNSPRHWWSALDFGQPAVLEHLARIQEEVCSRYDVDGVEVDYFRSPMFFRPNLDYQPATPAQRAILTGFQRRLREIHVRAGNRRSRPILTVARVPATVAACRHVGIEIRTWLREGLVDLLTVGGGYIPFTEPVSELVRLAHGAGVPVYSTLSASGLRGPENRYSTAEAWRGAAAVLWRAGVDGLVIFNLFPTGPEPRFQELGAPASLAGKNKLFAVDPVRILEGDLVQGIEQRQALPLSLPADGAPATARLPLGDDLAAAERQGNLAGVALRARLQPARAAAGVEVSLNRARLTPERRDETGGWIHLQPPARRFRLGRNAVTFRRPGGLEGPVEVVLLEAEVRYR
ncbi:MAG: hypothetical protein FJX77_04425 [Armatimonadetes bacterium]|nr:hypothetical protein [Armatimonadota bacterium]